MLIILKTFLNTFYVNTVEWYHLHLIYILLLLFIILSKRNFQKGWQTRDRWRCMNPHLRTWIPTTALPKLKMKTKTEGERGRRWLAVRLTRVGSYAARPSPSRTSCERRTRQHDWSHLFRWVPCLSCQNVVFLNSVWLSWSPLDTWQPSPAQDLNPKNLFQLHVSSTNIIIKY